MWDTGRLLCTPRVTVMVEAQVRAEVLDLYAAYAHALDDGHIEEWVECFTRDGRLETTRPLLVTGRRDLADFGRLWLSAQAGPTRHCSWHHRLVAEGELVLGRSSAAVLQTTGEGVSILFTGTYRDVFAREDGAWRIRERHVTIDAPGSTVSSPARAGLRSVR